MASSRAAATCGLDLLLQPIALGVLADDEETGQGELSERPGMGEGVGGRRHVHVLQHRLGAAVGREVGDLLAGVLEGEEERLGGRAAGLGESVEQRHRLFDDLLVIFGEPLGGDRALLLEVGDGQVNHLVECRGEGDLGGSDRGAAAVGGLEQARVEHHLPGPAGGLRTEPHPQLLVLAEGAGEASDGRRHPLITGDDGLNDPLFWRKNVGEHGMGRSRISASTIAVGDSIPRAVEPLPCPLPGAVTASCFAVALPSAAGYVGGWISVPMPCDSRVGARVVVLRPPGGRAGSMPIGTPPEQSSAGTSAASVAVDESLRTRLVTGLGSRVRDGVITITAGESRSQWRNRQMARRRLAELLEGALRERRRRVPTRPSRSAHDARIKDKRRRGADKRLRKPPEIE